MKFYSLVVWVLALSWLTHAAASPSWRAPDTVEVFLNPTQAAEISEWEAKPASTTIVAAPGPSMVLNPDIDKWGRAIKSVRITPTENLYRLKATLSTDGNPLQRFTLFPAPVFNIRVNQAKQKYPLVERPMFFRSEVHIDEIMELTEPHEQVELAFITAVNSNWQLSNLSLSAVREHVRYIISFTALIGLWGLTLLWGAVKAWHRSRLPTLAVGGLLVIGLLSVLATRAQVMQAFKYFVSSIRSIVGETDADRLNGFMQFGHIGLFCALTFAGLAFRRQWRLTYGQILIGVIVLTTATEALQRHSFGRSPNMQDIIFDSLGIVLGVVLYEVCTRLINSVRRLPMLCR